MKADKVGRLFALILFFSHFAQATNDTAAAEVLFQAGRNAMRDGNYDAACAKFDESARLDPAPGSVMNLATCEEKRGDLAAAWERWQQAIRLLKSDDRRMDFAEGRLAELEASLPRLTISSSQGGLSGFTVTRNGVLLRPASLGTELPVNPGKHEVVVTAANHQARTYHLELASGEQKELQVRPGAPLSDERAGKRANTQRALGYLAAGVGVVGLGSGIATSFLVKNQKATVEENCVASQCNHEGVNAAKQGKTLLALNTASFIAAGVGLGTATVLFLTLKSPPSEKDAHARIGLDLSPSGAWARISGEF